MKGCGPSPRARTDPLGRAGRRRPGAKGAIPRVRGLVNAVLAENVEAVREAYRRAATNPKTVLQCLELAAKLN